MRTILENDEWFLKHSCSCGGTRKETWTNINYPGIEIQTQPQRGFFFIKKNNETVSSGKNRTNEFETAYNTFVK